MPRPRICPTCNQKFDITKWQKSKIYCTEVCKPTWRPNRGGAVGRPKAKKGSSKKYLKATTVPMVN